MKGLNILKGREFRDVNILKWGSYKGKQFFAKPLQKKKHKKATFNPFCGKNFVPTYSGTKGDN